MRLLSSYRPFIKKVRSFKLRRKRRMEKTLSTLSSQELLVTDVSEADDSASASGSLQDRVDDLILHHHDDTILKNNNHHHEIHPSQVHQEKEEKDTDARMPKVGKDKNSDLEEAPTKGLLDEKERILMSGDNNPEHEQQNHETVDLKPKEENERVPKDFDEEKEKKKESKTEDDEKELRECESSLEQDVGEEDQTDDEEFEQRALRFADMPSSPSFRVYCSNSFHESVDGDSEDHHDDDDDDSHHVKETLLGDDSAKESIDSAAS